MTESTTGTTPYEAAPVAALPTTGTTKMDFGKYHDKTYADAIRIDLEYVDRILKHHTSDGPTWSKEERKKKQQFIAWCKSSPEGKKVYEKEAKKQGFSNTQRVGNDDDNDKTLLGVFVDVVCSIM